MNRIRLLLLLLPLCWLNATTSLAQVSTHDSLFAHYFHQAQILADAYPREKVHLHIDNTSYYVGDTIWFKAYVVLAENNRPSTISTPLYVELVDQMGYATSRLVIKLKDGEGCGQIPLTKYILSGYYEIRAYTKWMLAFSQEHYFSRVVPIYRRLSSNNEQDRSIATYSWEPSFRLRPKEKRKKLSLRFFPEGGQLVQGVPSIVAFKAESKDEDDVRLSGTIQEKENVVSFETLHEGMGYFMYTPTKQTATVQVTWNDKKYSFQLPQALPKGYVLYVQRRGTQYEIRVMRNEKTICEDTLAVFFCHQGRPIAYHTVKWKNKTMERFTLPAKTLPEGVMQVSLINHRCETLCERFCYVHSSEPPLQLQAHCDMSIYPPFAPITCKVSLKDEKGMPVKGKVSIALRNRNSCDYMEQDNTLYTDLLLTSDLKGYIHQPGYYFIDQSEKRLRALDALMLVHGWRKYDMETALGAKECTPRYQPEQKLTLHGQVESIILRKAQAGLEVGLLTRTDSLFATGTTLTDSAGYFSIPVMPFEETMEAVFQTHKPGKRHNRMCYVKLFRNFRPELRTFSLEELNPQWETTDKLKEPALLYDSIYWDSIYGPDNHWIDPITINAKHKQRMTNTLRFEKNIIAFYDIEQMLDEKRDMGKDFLDIKYLLRDINAKYTDMAFIVNGKANNLLSSSEQFNPLLIEESINAIKYLLICKNADNVYDMVQNGSIDSNYLSLLDNYNYDDRNWAGDKDLGKPKWLAGYIITKDGWNPHLRYDYTRGIRYTTIQGYTRPLEFYSPAYLPDTTLPQHDRRRTLYWHPHLETDENGEAVIRCFNSDSSGFLSISAETIHNGRPVGLNIGITETAH